MNPKHKTKQPVIVLSGSGSGGHITPLLAIAHELKLQKPACHIFYIGHKGDNLADIPTGNPEIDQVFLVRAGKFRRFHGEGLKQLLDLPTLLKNVRDLFFVFIGFFQSRALLKKLSPDVIFIKGGYIGVPVGLSAATLGIAYITHDSDAIPGLANRITSRWAALHAVALPEEVYGNYYPLKKTITTGIPLQAGFVPVTKKIKQDYRKKIKVPKQAKLIFVIGGGLGAQRVNKAVGEALPHLLNEFKDLYVVQSVGRANLEEVEGLYNGSLTLEQQGRVKLFGYLDDVYLYSGAADLVITRAGATNLAEFALQGKACLVIPNPVLTSGHQLKNAEVLSTNKAAVIIAEDDVAQDPNRLAKQVSKLLNDPKLTERLGHSFSTMAYEGAANKLAQLILRQGLLKR